MLTKLSQTLNLSALTLALVLLFGASYALAWTPPTAPAPGGNAPAPLNTSVTAQTKAGALTLGTVTAPTSFTTIGSIGATGDICTTVTGSSICLSTGTGGGGTTKIASGLISGTTLMSYADGCIAVNYASTGFTSIPNIIVSISDTNPTAAGGNSADRVQASYKNVTTTGATICGLTSSVQSSLMDARPSLYWYAIEGGGGGSVPAGAVTYFNLAVCPNGWLPADGTNGTPDLRGEFVRGLDNGRGVDAGRTLGSAQADMLKSHTHVLYSNLYQSPTPSGGFYGLQGSSGSANTQTVATGGTETRPRNVALLACIKS